MTTPTPAEGEPIPPLGATPPPGPEPGRPATPGAGFFAQIRHLGLFRSDERWIGGVAGGLAVRFGLDPLLVRGIFLLSLLFGGFGLVIYALAWAFLPEERDGRIHLEGLVAGHPDIALLGALLMLAVGFAGYAFTRWMIFVPGWIQGLCWLAAVAAIVALVIYMLQHRRPTNPQPAGTPFAGSPYATPAAPYRGPAADAPFGAPFAAPPAGPAPAAGFAAAMSGSMGTPGSPMPVPPPIWTGPAAASGPAPSHYATAPMPTPIVVTAPPAVVGAPKQPKPPKPPKPRYPRAGAATFGIVVGLSLLVIVGSLIAQRTGWLHAYAAAGTAAALIVVIFGIALIVTGLRGRRGGGIGFLALIAMIVALPLAVTTHNGTNPWIVDANGVHVQTTQGTVTVTDRTTAAQGLQMGFGSATLDLTGVPLETNNQLTVPINLSAGNLVVVVPAGSQVAAQVDVGAGQLSWQVGGENTSVSGLGRQTDLGVPAGQADLMLQITVGAGQVTVQEGTR